MSKQAWIIFVVVCVAVLGGLVYLSKGNQVDVSSVNASGVIAGNDQNGNIADHVYGTKEGKATLIEYGDFQCPACGSAYPNLKTVKEEFKDSLTFIFRNFPLTSLHPNARAAAAAAEAAGLQGKYWEMHDQLFEKQNEWSSASTDERLSFFNTYAAAAGVKDMDKFKADLNAENINEKISFDLALGKKQGASATPTILLGDEKIESDVWSNPEKLKAKIEEALK